MSTLCIKSSLGQLSSLITSGSRGWAQFYSESGALFLRMTNLPKEGIALLLSDKKYVELPSASKEGKRTNIKQNDILISITAELGRIGFVENNLGEAYVNQHVALIRINHSDVDPKYLAYYLAATPQRNLWQRLNDSGAKSALNLQTISNFPTSLPSLPEQNIIADMLFTWDSAIETMERLIKAKGKRFKWVLSQLINKGSKSNGWETVKLGEICISVTSKNNVAETNVLTSSAQHGLVSQLDYYNKSVSGADLSGYYLLKKGDFAYNRSSSNGYPFGAIKRLDSCKQGVLSTLYLCFRIAKKDQVDSNYLLHYFESGILNRSLRGICQAGARSHGLLNLLKGDFFGLKLSIPSIDRQKQIAEILDTAQQEIELLKRLAEKYKEQKRGLMQKLLTGRWRVKTSEEVY